MHSILVLSDIHGDIDTLNLILEKENYDYVFFLGDAIDYYWKEENKEVIDKLSNISKILFSVKGNCDNFHTSYNNPLIQRITIDNIKVEKKNIFFISCIFQLHLYLHSEKFLMQYIQYKTCIKILTANVSNPYTVSLLYGIITSR